jgi:nitrate/TMAO reductase-like tetraheme cytochrome c subunit
MKKLKLKPIKLILIGFYLINIFFLISIAYEKDSTETQATNIIILQNDIKDNTPLANDDDDLLGGDDDDDLLGGDDDDDLLGGDDDDDLLGGDDENDNKKPIEKKDNKEAEKAHASLYAESKYPSASTCAKCHPRQYEEWRGSAHAYASISPMFHKFEQKISDLSQGTIGTFCVRCHASVGTALGEPREAPIWERSKVSREGITCITCHRVNEAYGKMNGERRIIPGDIFGKVYGPYGGDGVKEVLENAKDYKVLTGKKGIGQKIHLEGVKFTQLTEADFCMSCHQVAVHPGIKLEVVWDQYKSSPAKKQGISCQDCHMGIVPGDHKGGYATGPAAYVNGKVVNPNRRASNHSFVGPGYSIAHPGIFPHHPKGQDFEIEDWLKFDYRSGWGTEEFEQQLEDGKITVKFPEAWEDIDDRFDARSIINDNLANLATKKKQRKILMEHSTKLEGPFFDDNPEVDEDLDFSYKITNKDLGHNFPSGSLGAQPEIWLNVALTDPSGKNIWESGHLDNNGDFADLHSLEVAAGKIDHDDQLFNLQTKFLTTNVKGTEREMYLPINLDIDQLPFIRPANVPTTVLNHPPFVRMESRSIPPLGSKNANYSIPSKLLQKPGKYKLSVRMRSRAEPIYFMKFVESTPEMIRSMNEWLLDFHTYTVEFEVK